MKRIYKILIALLIGAVVAGIVLVGWAKQMPIGFAQVIAASIWIIAPTALTAAWTKR